MRLILLLLGLSVIASGDINDLSDYEDIEQEWIFFKRKHNKNYFETEERDRFKIYVENKDKITKHNALQHKSYTLGINKYADLRPDEIKKMNGFNYTLKKLLRQKLAFSGVNDIKLADVDVPSDLDWREKGAVTEVKDQGHCGSCWAFSSTGSLEGQHFRKTGFLTSLSEQNLVDCSTKYGNNGCNGGLMDQAFQYIKENGGIDKEINYPYLGINGSCRFNRENVGATDKGFTDIPEGREDKLKIAVALHGPVSVAIDASLESFQFYSDGVYDDPNCSSTELDHGVLVVGYGTDNDVDYWLVKNSWGTTWGNEGYIKMLRNKDNLCGIASSASIPLV